jgi:predicted  nucleic acid-binding Zn-ribbon protein
MAKKLSDDFLRWVLTIDGSDAQKSIFDLEVETKKLQASNASLAKSMKELEAEGKKYAEQHRQLSAELQKLQVQNLSLAKSMQDLEAGGKKDTEAYRLLAAEMVKVQDRSASLVGEMEALEARQKKNSDAAKLLQSEIKKGSDAIAENKAKIDALVQSLSVNELTMEQLRKRSGELQRQLDKTSLATDPEAYKKLQKALQETTVRMEEVRRSGKSFVQSMSEVPGPIGAVGKAVQGLLKMLSLIVAHPVVAVIAAVVAIFMALKKAIASSEEATSKLNIILAPLGAALDFVLNIVQKLAKAFLDFAAWAIKGLSTLAESLPLIGDGMAELNKKAQEAIELEKAKVALRQRELEWVVESAKIEDKVARLRSEVAKKDQHTAAQRLAMINEAINAEQRLAEENKRQADERYRIAKAEADRADNTKEVNDKLIQLEAEKIKANTAYYENTMRLEKQRSTLVEQIAKEEKEAKENQQKERESALKAAADREKTELAKQRAEGKLSKEEYDEELRKVDENHLNKRITLLKKFGKDASDVEKQLAEIGIRRIEKEEAENLKILAEREKYFAALKKVSDDYARTQVEKDEAELLAIKQKYAAAAEASKVAHSKQLIDDETFANEQAELQAMLDKELSAKAKEQQEEREKQEKEATEKLARERNRILKELNMLNLDQLQKEEMEKLAEFRDQKLITEEEYQQALLALEDRYNQLREEQDGKALKQKLAGYRDALAQMQAVGQVAGSAIAAIEDAEQESNNLRREQEMAKVTEDYNKKMALAEGDAEAQQRIKEELAAEKERIDYEAAQENLDTQKKYADANFAVQAAQAAVTGIISAMQAFSAMAGIPVVGPALGAMAAAAVGVTTALQIASLNKERQRIKSTTLEAPSSSASGGSVAKAPAVANANASQQRIIKPEEVDPSTIVKGYASGGYTGDGGVHEPAGVVHRGEYVVPQVVMRDPAAITYVGALEKIRSAKGLAGRAPGRSYAEGGYVQPESEGPAATPPRLLALIEKTERTMAETARTLAAIRQKGLHANIGVTELEAEQKRLQKSRVNAQ